MGDILEDATTILTMKQWAALDFDSFWEFLQEAGDSRLLLQILSKDPEAKERAKKFYEKMTPEWLEQEALDSPELEKKSLVQFIRISMTYSFLFGYADKIKRS